LSGDSDEDVVHVMDVKDLQAAGNVKINSSRISNQNKKNKYKKKKK